MIASESELIRLALALGAAETGGRLTARERAAVVAAEALPVPAAAEIRAVRSLIRDGEDPLGAAFLRLRDAGSRRDDGAVYTPVELVAPMVEWTLSQNPQRVVDAGAGSGRFLAEVLRRAPSTTAIAVDLDPLATLMTRGTVGALGVTAVQVKQTDYTRLKLPSIEGVTAFLGNPPYVRHHQLTPQMKAWAQTTAGRLGHRVSGLAGLHAYFFLATATLARPRDVGCFVTSSEWLDVNYGAIMRVLVLDDLGGESLHVVEPKALPFEGTQTTAVITTFRVGQRPPSIRMQAVEALNQLGDLSATGHPVARARLAEAPRWSGLLRMAEVIPEGFVELGELCRVHRGAVTGANATWVLRHGGDLPPSVLYRSVTKARELFAAGNVLSQPEQLRMVVDLPRDLDELEPAERKVVERFLRSAKRAGVDKGYIAAHRRSWWSIGLKPAAPILATYMARRPPAFVLNAAAARHINIAHGLYPRDPMDAHTLGRLAEVLRTRVELSQGRVYAGGLTKFEPKEMERLMVPGLDMLRSHESLSAAVDA